MSCWMQDVPCLLEERIQYPPSPTGAKAEHAFTALVPWVSQPTRCYAKVCIRRHTMGPRPQPPLGATAVHEFFSEGPRGAPPPASMASHAHTAVVPEGGSTLGSCYLPSILRRGTGSAQAEPNSRYPVGIAVKQQASCCKVNIIYECCL
jgi:hypothetical protein